MSAPAGFGIHRLCATDEAAMRSMLAMFGRAFDDPEAYGGKPPRARYLRDLLADDGFIAIAALQDGGSVVGGLAA